MVNIRDCSVILRHGTETKQSHQSFHLHLHKDDEASRIQSIRWFVCAADGGECSIYRDFEHNIYGLHVMN